MPSPPFTRAGGGFRAGVPSLCRTCPGVCAAVAVSGALSGFPSGTEKRLFSPSSVLHRLLRGTACGLLLAAYPPLSSRRRPSPQLVRPGSQGTVMEAVAWGDEAVERRLPWWAIYGIWGRRCRECLRVFRWLVHRPAGRTTAGLTADMGLTALLRCAIAGAGRLLRWPCQQAKEATAIGRSTPPSGATANGPAGCLGWAGEQWLRVPAFGQGDCPASA